MVKIGTAEILSGITAAAWVYGEEIALIVFVGQTDSATPGKKCGTSGIACWDNTVKHIDTALNTFQDIFGRPTPIR